MGAQRGRSKAARQQPRIVLLLAGMVFVGLVISSPARGAERTSEGNDWSELRERLDVYLKVVGYGTFQSPVDAPQNPDNTFFNLPDRQADLEARPDIYLDLSPLNLSIKPRFSLQWQSWETGNRSGDSEWDQEVYINEWLARVGVRDSVFVSYGRENLQWGPAYLLSPSNPFFDDNGRSKPKQEVAGMDFARCVWLPNASWSLSLIANTDPGRQPINDDLFEPAYALKLDWVGMAANGGMVVSYREEDRPKLGFYGGITATDALLIYGEGHLTQGSDALYPVLQDKSGRIALEPVMEDSPDVQSLLLIGGAYTLALGPTLTLEYAYNSSGYNPGQAEQYYGLRQTAGEDFSAGGPGKGPAAGVLAQTADVGLRLLRKHYLMVQYSHNDIRDVLDLVFRWTYNLDDQGTQLIAIADLAIGDHLELFTIGTANLGGTETEFGSFLENQLMVGVQYVF
jgi:hypothetical protein